MNWTDFLKSETEAAFRATYGLVNMCDDKSLNWKPANGENWMTVGQLLEHLTIACGFCMKGFVTGEWCPDERPPEEQGESAGLLPAEKMPAAKSVKDALARLKADEKLAYEMIAKAGEKRLQDEDAKAPWGTEKKLGPMLNDMIQHLVSHKSQLFYYLKLQGKPVNTMTLWGMG